MKEIANWYVIFFFLFLGNYGSSKAEALKINTNSLLSTIVGAPYGASTGGPPYTLITPDRDLTAQYAGNSLDVASTSQDL